MNEDKNSRLVRLPSLVVPVGGEVLVGGIVFVCVDRPRPQFPRDVCSGCDLRSRFCNNIACCRSDRGDGHNVWFVKKNALGEKGGLDSEYKTDALSPGAETTEE